MLNFLKFKKLKGTWLEIPSILLFCVMFLFIPFFIWSKALYILQPILNYFTACVAIVIVWHFIIGPILDDFTDWFTED